MSGARFIIIQIRRKQFIEPFHALIQSVYSLGQLGRMAGSTGVFEALTPLDHVPRVDQARTAFNPMRSPSTNNANSRAMSY